VLIVDTGPFVAIADATDPDHAACRDLLETAEGPLVTTALVVTEAGWLIRRELGISAETRLYADNAAGDVQVEELTTSDWERVIDLLTECADARLDAADASVIAESLNQLLSPPLTGATSASSVRGTPKPSICSL
jgi:predicted nucleic acid-binding protein